MSDNEARIRLALDILERFNTSKITRAQAAALIQPLGLPEVYALVKEVTP